MNKADVCVLIPGYNEGKNISRVVRQVIDHGFCVLVVDDGSTDSTAEEARLAGAEVLSGLKNMGKGASLRRGFEACLKKRFAAVITMDADGQHDAAELDLFLNAVNETDKEMIVGNRMHSPKNMPFVRRLTNRTMSQIISMIAKQPTPDSQCGYRLLKREMLQKMRLSTSHFEIESEMLLEAGYRGFKIGSIPIRSVYEGGTSKIRPFRDTVRFLNFLIKYLFSRKKT